MNSKLLFKVIKRVKWMSSIEVFVIFAMWTLYLTVVSGSVRFYQLVIYATLFEARLKQYGIEHHLIRPYTPRHNGKVERSHRKDNEYFYATHSFYSFDDFKKQLAVHSRKYNNFPMRPLNWKSPADYIKAYLRYGEVFWFCNTSLTNLHFNIWKNFIVLLIYKM